MYLVWSCCLLSFKLGYDLLSSFFIISTGGGACLTSLLSLCSFCLLFMSILLAPDVIILNLGTDMKCMLVLSNTPFLNLES